MRRRGWWQFGTLVWVALAVTWASAQEKDYGPGFESLFKLGLPRTAGATYVNVGSRLGGQRWMGGAGGEALKLAGDAWLLKRNETGPSQFVQDDVTTVEWTDRRVLTRQLAEERKAVAGDPAKLRAWQMTEWERLSQSVTWTPADVKQDAAALLAYVQKLAEQKAKSPEMRQRLEWLGRDGTFARWFLKAAHFYENGCQAEANQTVAQLFALAGNPREVVAGALNVMANTQYQAALTQVSAQGDWPAFAKQLTDLRTRFGANWKQDGGVGVLLTRLKPQLAAAAPPPLAAPELTAADQELALALAKPWPEPWERGIFADYGGVWVLPSPRFKLPGTAAPSPLARITDRGLAAVPLLLALLKDEWFVPACEGNAGGYDAGWYDDGNAEDQSAEDRAEAQYKMMARPRTRGELAQGLLVTLLPRGDENAMIYPEVENADALRDQIQKWYTAHKDQPLGELARAYLTAGDPGQRMGAVTYLVAKGTPEDLAALETWFTQLPDAQLGETGYSVVSYLEKRGKAGEEFGRKFLARVKALAEKAGAGKTASRRHPGGADQFTHLVEQIEAIYSTESAETLLADVAAGRKDWEAVASRLQRKLDWKHPDATLGVLLKAASEAPTPALAANALHYAYYAQGDRWMRARGQDPEEEAGEGAEPKAEPLSPQTHAALWTKLLADERRIGAGAWEAQSTRVADVAAGCVEMLYGQVGDNEGQTVAYNVLGARLYELLRSRARARVAGKPEAELPPLPTGDAVTPEQRQALLAKVLAAPPAQVAALLGQADLNQVLALATDEPPELAKHLAAQAHTVRSVAFPEAKGEVPAELAAAKGKVLSKDVLLPFVEYAKAQVTAGRAVYCVVHRQPLAAGVDVEVQTYAADAPELKTHPMLAAMAQEGRTASVTGVAQLGEVYHQTQWPVAKQAPTAPAKPAATADDLPAEEDVMDERGGGGGPSSPDQFWDQLKPVFAGEAGVLSTGSLMFYGFPVQPAPAAPKDEQK